ncbi:hypothetical protein M2323_001307 [Rhodoblastus acidophilus]|uniref:DUF2023 family protein n=1 Tax=Rhodoblastus acidophilus TaxID=1074 RepID=UPI001607872A|nr:DUF2023 family protein [Rhodoblastus acidophilus]MCW2283535.1 hypothetical protein [Rhodoblastus acidophilus]MCW2332395.1 hypothetical protein [Rhodoblastus acidophilus]
MAQPIALTPEGETPFAPPCAADGNAFLRLFHHHIYEYGRGVRALFLLTLNRAELAVAVARLQTCGIDHFVQTVCPNKGNLFFGRSAFVDVARALATRPLNALTAEEDFMLGALLGYDREQQCLRYLARSGRAAFATAAE